MYMVYWPFTVTYIEHEMYLHNSRNSLPIFGKDFLRNVR